LAARALVLATAVALGAAACESKPSYDGQNPDQYGYAQPYSAPSTPNNLYPTGKASNGLVPCYDKTIDDAVQSVDHYRTAEPIHLTADPKTGNAKGDPGPLPPKVLSHVLGAIVEVDSPDQKGSGFLIAPNLVLTAAHVPDSIGATVVDHQGHKSAIVDGCYLRQENGVAADPNAENSTDIDVAVLRLKTPIGKGILKMASTVNRGDWITLVNAQEDSTAKNPSIYNGLYLSAKDQNITPEIFTGIVPNGSTDPNTYILESGASGGVGVNREDEVVFMSTAGAPNPDTPGDLDTESGAQRNLDWLSAHYNVFTPGGLADNLPPDWYVYPAEGMSIRTMNEAIASSRY